MKKLALLLSVVCLSLLSCESNSDKNATPNESNSENSDQTEGTSENTENGNEESDEDRMLSQKVRQSLSNDPNLTQVARKIDVTSNNGNVTLAGAVNSEREKVLIANKVRQINGVNGINNQLEVSGQGATGVRRG